MTVLRAGWLPRVLNNRSEAATCAAPRTRARAARTRGRATASASAAATTARERTPEARRTTEARALTRPVYAPTGGALRRRGGRDGIATGLAISSAGGAGAPGPNYV